MSGNDLPDSEAWHEDLFPPLETFEDDKKMLSELHSTVGRYTSYKYNAITFEFASCLATSQDDDDLNRAASLFQELADEGYRQRDTFYRAAVCFFTLGKFAESRRAIEMCRELDPKFDTAQRFAEFLACTTYDEGKAGMAIAVGIFAFVLLVVGLRRSTRQRLD